MPNMLRCGGGKNLTNNMCLLNLVFIFFSVSGISGELPIFNKCCEKNLNLIQVTDVTEDSTEIKYKCLDYNIEIFYNISNRVFPLILPDDIHVKYGLPQHCDLQLLSLVQPELALTIDTDICYDRLVLGVTNGTTSYMVPKTIQLKCVTNQIDERQESIVRIEQIRKCCPKGQSYDLEYHVCRNNEENNDKEWLVNSLNKHNNSLYEIEIGLHCKLYEYAVELNEGNFTFDVEGSFLKVGRDRDDVSESLHAKGEWCIDREHTTGVMIARVCTNDCAKYNAFCLRKCCPIGEHFLPGSCYSLKSMCVPNTEESVAFNISAYLDPLKSQYTDFEDNLGIRTTLSCPRGRVALNRSAYIDRHHLTRSGSLYSPISVTNEYCVETFDTRKCTGDVTLSALVCFVKPLEQQKDFWISFVLISISSVCLALTLLVYCTVPELRNQHGRTLICHLITMLLAYSCLARVQYGLVENKLLCAVLGYGIYFGFVAAFAWLNVMCFDIWWTFGTVRSTRPMHKSNAQRRRFLWYSLYAWSTAIILTLTTFLLDKYPISPILQAKIGRDMCWFGSLQNDKTDWPHYILFVIPMGIVTGTNFVLWVLTARHCARVKSEMHRLQAGSANDREKRRFRINRAKYVLTGKLWIVMGAGWVSELLSTLAQEPQWLWFIVDLLNELQGVFIFIILIFKPKLYYLIRKRLGLEKPAAQKNGTSSSSGRTSTTYLSRTISNDERATLRVSVPNNVKQH